MLIFKECYLRKKLKDNLFSNVFSLLFGGIITTLLFFSTSHPIAPEDVKKELLGLSLAEMKSRYGDVVSESTIDKISSAEIDMGADKSIVFSGSTKINGNIYRWVSIFERSPPRIFDKLVGRSGFFRLSSLTSYEAPYFNSLLVDKIEIIDFDGDGKSEIHIRLKSIWADSTSVGPLILSKNDNAKWHLSTLPSISNAINSPLKNPKMGDRRPYRFFGMVGDEDPQLKTISELNHNGNEQEFSTLRNGGDYIFRNHTIKGYSQIQTLSFFMDGEAVLGPHYAVVNMFKFGENSIETDELWNWEHPMYSTRPLRLLEIDMDSIFEAGIMSHTVGDIFYGYTEFEKIRVQK
jgi:hypothetical protein